MKTVAKMVTLVVGAFALTTVACSTETDDGVAPEAADVSLDGEQLVTTTNADGTWTGNAYTFETYGPLGRAVVNAAADFTGPAGKKRKMGLCLLRMSSITCTATTQAQVDSQCASITLPTGGSRYCTAPNGSGTKKCAWREGPPSTYCAGSPALAGAAVSPGTYTAPGKGNKMSVPYISYACFEACAVTDPSSSSAAYALPGSGGCYDRYGNPIPC